MKARRRVNSTVGLPSMNTPDMSLERFYLIRGDLRHAREFADYILRRHLHGKNGETTQLIHRAFNLSMIVSYCRPFMRNLEGPDRELEYSPIGYLAKEVLGRDGWSLHKKVIAQRNEIYAHSPTGKRFPWLPKQGTIVLQFDVFAPLNFADTRTLRSNIKSWLLYLEPLKSQYS